MHIYQKTTSTIISIVYAGALCASHQKCLSYHCTEHNVRFIDFQLHLIVHQSAGHFVRRLFLHKQILIQLCSIFSLIIILVQFKLPIYKRFFNLPFIKLATTAIWDYNCFQKKNKCCSFSLSVSAFHGI